MLRRMLGVISASPSNGASRTCGRPGAVSFTGTVGAGARMHRAVAVAMHRGHIMKLAILQPDMTLRIVTRMDCSDGGWSTLPFPAVWLAMKWARIQGYQFIKG